MKPKNSQQGFSLIELMITVAIIGILAAISIPAYNNYIQEGRFAATKANLLNVTTFVGDFGLDNEGDYTALNGLSYEGVNGGVSNTLSVAMGGWEPGGKTAQLFLYEVLTGNTTGAIIQVTHPDDSTITECFFLGNLACP